MEKHELPHDLLAEKSLLGCFLIDGHSFDEISELNLKVEDFYHPQYGLIYGGIKDLFLTNRPIDFVSVCSKLADQGHLDKVGGQAGIGELIEDQASSANVYHYGKIIKDKSVIRDIVRTAQKVALNGLNFNGNVEDFITDVESSFFKLTSQTRTGGLKDIKSFLKTNIKELQNPERPKDQISGVPSGFPALDKRLMGMQPGQLLILAARPGMGKTALALNIAVHSCAATKLPVAIFSLEMLGQELSMRLLSAQASVDSQRMKTKSFFDTDLRNIMQATTTLSEMPIYINDAADITLLDIKSQCRKIRAERGLALVVVDYIQLMKSHTNNPSREQQISEISRGLKNLAKELECPVLALSQLNRAVESRTDKRPMVSDLRESGSIEQDADIVMLVYRDEVYYPESPRKGIAEIIVGKNRAGEVGTVDLGWIGSQTKFSNLSHENSSSR